MDLGVYMMLLIQDLADPFEAGVEILIFYRLEQLVRGMIEDGSVHVRKILISCQKDKGQIWIIAGQMPAQIDAGHDRHADIGEHHIHIVGFDIFQGLKTVCKLPCDLVSILLPGKQVYKAFSDFDLIIYNNK